VVIHTGNWGCGAFGGSVELHSLLQIVAANMAQVHKMGYHSFDKASMEKVCKACKRLQKIFDDQNSDTYSMQWEDFINEIMNIGYSWGMPNGT